MHPDRRKRFTSLLNIHDPSMPLYGICQTNGFGIGLDDWPMAEWYEAEFRYIAVGDLVSRINHSCCPNVSNKFYVPAFAFEVFAVRDIPAGEEITTTYVDVFAPAAERQDQLEEYGFQCTCPACADPAAFDRIRGILDDAPRPNMDGSVSLKAALQMLSMIERVGLHGSESHCEYLVCTAIACRLAGQFDKADMYNDLAARLLPASEYRDRELREEVFDRPTYYEVANDADVRMLVQYLNGGRNDTVWTARSGVPRPTIAEIKDQRAHKTAVAELDRVVAMCKDPQFGDLEKTIRWHGKFWIRAVARDIRAMQLGTG